MERRRLSEKFLVVVAVLLAGGAGGAGGAGAAARPATAPAAGILAEYWNAVPGESVASLSAHRKYPFLPDRHAILPTLELPDRLDSYGVRLRGWIMPPASGEYTFYIAGDDESALLLSPTDNPADARRIAWVAPWSDRRSWEMRPSQKSAPIRLEQGRRYAIEVVHKGGGGPNHLAVGWKLPDGTFERPIPGSRLTPAPRIDPAAAPPPPPTTVRLDAKPALATWPGQHKFPRHAHISGPGLDVRMSYLIHLPEGYAPDGPLRPAFVFLHGNTHQGWDLEGILNEGPAQDLNRSRPLREFWPFVGIFPQLPPGWRFDSPEAPRAVAALVEELVRRYRVDPRRVYLSGLSMGGKGTWLVALERPDLFAAIAPLCAVAVEPEYAAQRLKDLPTWIIVGDSDGGYTEGSRRMYEALKRAGCSVQITVERGVGHGVWAIYYPRIEFYRRLMELHRGPATGPAAKPPR